MRIQSIDYLRGLMSLSIVFYHFTTSFTSWGLNDSGALLGRLGVYAVSAFYIISGMALYLAHKNDKWSLSSYLIFVFRRFLRLAPVYWIAIIIFTAFAFQYINGFSIDSWKYIQNVFLIFGITNPTEYMIMGGWSIGNEVVFYLFFPLLILMCKDKRTVIVLSVLALTALLYCSGAYLDPSKGIVEQWARYINPFNQIYFFIFGIVAAKLLLPFVGKNKALFSCFAIATFIAFCLYPVEGNQIKIITGVNKLFFTVVTIFICSAFFLIGDFVSLKPLHSILKFLGDVSYPLYLLHGVSFSYFRQIVFYKGMSDSMLITYGACLLVMLLVLSWICHIAIERPMIKLGRYVKNNDAVFDANIVKSGAETGQDSGTHRQF
ncbi:acyltransferase 3 [Enterobacter cloacae]|nr:acyltransferase 3 [Enterobacter cloacae]VAM08168.1 acyltransferase 3 [Enterobacter kobei]